ncbi:MAG: hypothetical protein K9N23_12545 [Akkermansiaceae bacterium]|nr:hypothetical protein [Akkermansiaceae bacterium]
MTDDPITDGYDREQWMRVIERMAAALGDDGPPVRLCLIGSAVCLLGNMPDRASHDLDIWKPASTYRIAELIKAAEAAGVLFNPKDFLEPAVPYLQIVEPGIVQVGKFEPVHMETIGRLELYRPPVENIIASKLARAADKDLQDILYLIKTHQPDLPLIRKIVDSFPPATRSLASENLIYLEAAG